MDSRFSAEWIQDSASNELGAEWIQGSAPNGLRFSAEWTQGLARNGRRVQRGMDEGFSAEWTQGSARNGRRVQCGMDSGFSADSGFRVTLQADPGLWSWTRDSQVAPRTPDSPANRFRIHRGMGSRVAAGWIADSPWTGLRIRCRRCELESEVSLTTDSGAKWTLDFSSHVCHSEFGFTPCLRHAGVRTPPLHCEADSAGS